MTAMTVNKIHQVKEGIIKIRIVKVREVFGKSKDMLIGSVHSVIT